MSLILPYLQTFNPLTPLQTMKYYSFLLLLAVLLLAVGCSNKVLLSGTVTFTDGEPVPEGVVIFHADKGGTISQGGIKSDGTYTVGTDTQKDGLPRGTYRVSIGGTDLIEQRRVPDSSISGGFNVESVMMQRIDRKYTSPDTSGLIFNADGKMRTFDIQVERYSGR